MQYIIIKAESTEKLEEKVWEQLEEGWELHGSMAVVSKTDYTDPKMLETTFLYFQTMIYNEYSNP
jgi:hypothetical protein